MDSNIIFYLLVAGCCSVVLCHPMDHTQVHTEAAGHTSAQSTAAPSQQPEVEIPDPKSPVRRRCSRSEAYTVQREWEKVFNVADGGERRIILVQELFKTMFSSPTFKAHLMRLLTDLNVIVEGLHDDALLQSQLNHLAYKRKKYMGAHVGYYQAMTKALMVVLPQATGEFTRLAWSACLAHVGEGLTESRLARQRQLAQEKTQSQVCNKKNLTPNPEATPTATVTITTTATPAPSTSRKPTRRSYRKWWMRSTVKPRVSFGGSWV